MKKVTIKILVNNLFCSTLSNNGNEFNISTVNPNGNAEKIMPTFESFAYTPSNSIPNILLITIDINSFDTPGSPNINKSNTLSFVR